MVDVSIDLLVDTDQKAEAFWDRVQQYCEEYNPGVIKRGVVTMRKRWQRINEGAQKFRSCYEEAQKTIGSGSNLDDINERAHILHSAKYKKKSNFDKHCFDLRRQPKWRTPSTTESSKRTKLSNSGAYSSSGNNDTPTNENDVEGAQKFGSCYEEAQKTIGSGSNLDDINERAHILHSAKYKKKSNFDKHWFELRRQPKWRTPSTTESSKRTKLSNSGAYSSSENNDTPINENDVESSVRPKGTKAAKRKVNEKARTVETSDEYEELQASACRKLNLMEVLNETRQKEIETRQKEIEAKQTEMDLQVILAHTTKMNDAQRRALSKLFEKIMLRN